MRCYPDVLQNYLLNFGRALDCGSGIGRVTKHLLLPLFQKVDMVDFAENFIQNSREYIGEEAFARVGNQYVDSLHTFEPVENFYNVIWIQWVSGHLMDEDFVRFMKRCKVKRIDNLLGQVASLSKTFHIVFEKY